jgi:3-deoxy-D-manno-octulosonate 8-phosphate phosphatase (KDO 8-P phosphatase)
VVNNEPEVAGRAARVRLLLMDVDGVMTDGHLYNFPDANGHMVETKGFDSQDGIGLQWLSWYGVRTGLISGRNSPATVERARQCKMTYVYQGHIEKIPILEVMNRVGFAVATQNARAEVKAKAHYVTAAEGGRGAVREAIELILKARGHWPELLKKYEAI